MTATVSEFATPDRLLDQAADLIEAGGLTRGRYADSHGGYSIEGAVQAAARRARTSIASRPYREAIAALLDEIAPALARTARPGAHPLSSWNDHPSTSPEVAVDRLRRAARTIRVSTW